MNSATPVLPLVFIGLAACGGGGSGSGGPDDPTPDGGTVLYEAPNADGGGEMTRITLNTAADLQDQTVLVEGLPLDGDGIYTYVRPGLSFSHHFRSKPTVDDPDGGAVRQINYTAVWGWSPYADSGFAIVRTGDVPGYGYGGYMLFNDSDLVLPTSGQAGFQGLYEGIRIFDNQRGMNHTSGQVIASIDFDAFDGAGGVNLILTSRTVRDADFNVITADKIPLPMTFIPNVELTLAPGTLSPDGRISGEMISYAETGTGALVPYETGTLTALLSEGARQEMIGMIVIEGKDPEFAPKGEGWEASEVTYQETGGFIAPRW